MSELGISRAPATPKRQANGLREGEKLMTPEIRIIHLEAENRRLQATRPCWDNGVRICDTDRSGPPNWQCRKPATILWLDPRHDELYFCSQDCVDYFMRYRKGRVREIGKAHGLTVFEYTPEPDESDDEETTTTN